MPPRCTLRASAASSSASALRLDELERAIASSPELAPQIARLHETLGGAERMAAITKLVREQDQSCTQPTPQQQRPPASPLEEEQAAWRPTAAQHAAQQAAATEQAARITAAEAQRISKPVGRVWSSFGGEMVERCMLDHVDLVDARYLLSLHDKGGAVPRWQDVPQGARIDRSQVWRLYGWERMFSLGILVLSYPWLDTAHPDQHGEQLGRIAPLLRHMLAFCGGEPFTVGVMWDYCSLPQPPRSPAAADRFAQGLAALMTWYAHPYTHVLLLTTDLPYGAQYTNTRPYDAVRLRHLAQPSHTQCRSSTCAFRVTQCHADRHDLVVD